MMKIITATLMTLALGVTIGCLSKEEHLKQKEMEEHKEEVDAAVRILKGMHYFKDTRTNLCFAGSYLGYASALMTNVPCSPEVEKLIIEQQ